MEITIKFESLEELTQKLRDLLNLPSLTPLQIEPAYKDRDIFDLDLPTRLTNALFSENIFTKSQLRIYLSKNIRLHPLVRIKGIGRYSEKIIMEALDSYDALN